MSDCIPTVGVPVALLALSGLIMNHYNNDGNENWEFQWVEESINYIGHVFIAGLAGLACVLEAVFALTAAAIKEKTRK
jgi:phosphotransferase system  glucose/maltose/N-acetylglucosamine-specific IIC component